MLYKILIKDNREPFNVIQKNDPAKLNYKSEWIKFTVKNLYEWYKGKLSKKSNRKLKKVTELKTKELNENAHKLLMWFLAATVLFIYFLQLPSFLWPFKH